MNVLVSRYAASCLLILSLAVIAGCSSNTGPSKLPGVEVSGDFVTGTGTVTFYSFEGGFYAIRGDDEVTYDPLNLPDAFKRDGLRVFFQARIRRDLASFHMVGPVVEILKVERTSL